MGLPAAAALCIVGTLILAAASQDAELQEGLFPPCSATLAPEGPCEQEGDGCPFVFNLPPMTVNMPKQLMDLERLVEELQMLKDNVDELRKICKGCAASQAEKECTQGAEKDADNGSLDINAQIWENNKRVVNEKKEKNGKTLAKDKMEQVAAGKNVRITERKKLDRKQIERDGAGKGALDKQNSALGNATHMQNRTFGNIELWRDQMMDSKKQTEAADEMEDRGVKLSNDNEESDRRKMHVKTILDEKETKSDHQTKDQEDMMKNKDEKAKPSSRDSSNRHIWQDRHHTASHEDGAEKNIGNVDKGGTEQPIDRDRPVWRDKTRVDMNQMERKEEREEKASDASKEGGNVPKSSQSGRHVWQDETMETSSSAEKIKMSGSSGGDGDMGQDHKTNGEAKEGGESLREFENKKLMEGTDLHSGGQASVVNSAPSHGFIELDGPVTLTSPPSFIASHTTTDVERGQKEQNNEKGSSTKEQLRLDAELPRGGDGGKLENGGETNEEDQGQLEQPVLEIQPSYDERKMDIDIKQYRPTKTAPTVMPLGARSNSDLSTDLKNVRQNSKEIPKNVSADFEQTNHNKQFAKRVKQPTKIANRFFATKSKPSDSSREQKSTSRPPSRTTQEKYIHTEDSTLDSKSSTSKISGKDRKIVHSNHNKTKLSISKKVSTKERSDTTTSPIARTVMDVKQGGSKFSFGQPSQNNQGEKDSDVTDATLDEQMTKTSSEDSKSELIEGTSDTSSNSKSHFTNFKQEDRYEPSSQGNYNKVDSETEHSSSNSQIDASTSTPKLSEFFLTKDTKHGDKKASYSPSQNKSNEKASHPTSSSIDTQLSKTKIKLTTTASSEDSTSSTPTPPNLHLGKDVKQQQQIPDYKEKSQSNQNDNNHSSHSVGKAKAKDEYVTISTPTTSYFEQENENTFNGKLSQSDREIEHSSIDAPLIKATRKPNVVNENASSFNSIASNSETTTYNDNVHGETAKDIASPNTFSKDLEKESSSYEASAEVNSVQPTTELAEDATISSPTASKPRFNPKSNQGQRETTNKKTHYEQPLTDYNKKDVNLIQNPQMDTYTSRPASALVEDITSSSPVRTNHASFKDDITTTTSTSPQISPTTTLPPKSGSNKKLSGSKSIQNQKPKPTSEKKPEANLKLKNLKNDRKPDRTPSPDTRVKNNPRQVHPKVTPRPAQIPLESDQSTQLQVNDKDNPLQKARLPSQTTTDASNMTGLLTNGRKRPNATAMHDRRQSLDSEIDKKSGLKQFIKKTGNLLNKTGNVVLAQNRSSEFNGTKESSKKTPKINLKIPQIKQKTKPQVPKNKPAHPKLESNQKVKVEQAPKVKIPKVNTLADLKNSSKVLPGLKTPAKPVRSKTIPAAKTKQPLKVKEKMPKTYAVPTSVPIKLTTLNSTTAQDLEADLLRQNDTTSNSLTMNPNSGVISSEGPQTTDPVPSISLTTEPNKATQEPATLPTKIDLNEDENSPSSPSKVQLQPNVHTIFRSTAPPAPHAGAKVPAVENTTPSARELRVKINQVAAFLNKSGQQRPHGRPLDEGPGEQKEDSKKTDLKTDMMLVRDCSDHVLRGHTKSGQYLVTPDPSGGSVPVLCDMEEDGGGWTVLQRRHDGSVSFNRSWAEYRDGFGQLNGGEFWLGNNLINLLTRDRRMELRVELEDFEGVREYAQYELFKVASERMRFRLTVDGYSGTAGDALQFNTKYNHNNRAFTTPDRDNDRYPSGNCGAYYSSGWWFDACMAANLNGRYYKGTYKGVRDGIYWGTWHNISTEYYPTNERQSFKTVRMMIRPKDFKP